MIIKLKTEKFQFIWSFLFFYTIFISIFLFELNTYIMRRYMGIDRLIDKKNYYFILGQTNILLFLGHQTRPCFYILFVLWMLEVII